MKSLSRCFYVLVLTVHFSMLGCGGGESASVDDIPLENDPALMEDDETLSEDEGTDPSAD